MMNIHDNVTNSPKGLIFDIQPFSIHDGPGIRTTIFMKGCPLRCQWCSNPEGWYRYPELMTRNAKCQRCGRCAKACPLDAISVTDEERWIDHARCNRCFECVKACPNEALLITGKYVTVDEIVDEVARDLPFFRNSGGGITIGGGEPLQQWEFVAQVLKRFKEKGIHTAVETSGYAPWERMEALLKYTDLLLHDLKQVSSDIHKDQTGVDNHLILNNLEKAARKVRTWVRIPLIPGFNDKNDDIKRMIEFVSQLPVEKVSLLPYHGYGETKYEALGHDYAKKETQSLSDERVDELCNLINREGLKCTIRY